MSPRDKDSDGGSDGGSMVRPLRDGIDATRGHVTDAAGAVRDAAMATGDRARDLAHDAVASGRDTAAYARDELSGGIEGAPLAALAGSAAIGLLIGALLPRSERETTALGPLGSRLIDAAREALEAARDAGRSKLDESGLSRDGARDAVRGILDAALAAALSAGNAAAETAAHKVAETRD